MSSDVPAGLTVRDAPIDRPLESRPPAGRRTWFAIVLDDTGFGQLGCFGSDIDDPHIDALARGGLRYNRFHVTSLCSPLVRPSSPAEPSRGRDGVPGRHPARLSRLHRSHPEVGRAHAEGAAGQRLRHNGSRQVAPRAQMATLLCRTVRLVAARSRLRALLRLLAGRHQPLVAQPCRRQPLCGPPRRPEDGYHLTEDLGRCRHPQCEGPSPRGPGKPFFLYFALGAMHAPHHVAPEWVAPYRGAFDDGWDAWRARCFSRQLESGVVPPGTTLSERPQWVSAWDALSDDERRMNGPPARGVRRLSHPHRCHRSGVSSPRSTRVAIWTTPSCCSSRQRCERRGRRRGQRERAPLHRPYSRIAGRQPRRLRTTGAGFRTYNHYSWGWAWAGNTPNRLWKRYTWLGGTRTPLVVHWPAGIDARSGVRSQLVHVNDLWPTLADAIGIELPAVVDGVTQQRIDGSSIRATFSDPAAPDPARRSTSRCSVSRSIIHDGWKATTNHISTGVLDEEDWRSGAGTSARTAGAVQAGRRLLRVARCGRSASRGRRAPRGVWLEQAERTTCCRSDDTLVQRLGAFLAPAYHPGHPPCTSLTRALSSTSRCPCCSVASP